MRVEAYRNLTNNSLSVRRAGKGGRVFTRPLHAVLSNVNFVVQPKGRERVLQERRKNVHAFVRGEFVLPHEVPLNVLNLEGDWHEARYNPYKAASFIDKETGQPVTEAEVAVVTTKGVFYR